MALPVEKMLIAVHHLLDRMPRFSGDVQKRDEAYERLVSACIRAYFGGKGKS